MEETQLEPITLATLHNLLKTQYDPLNLTTRLYDAAIKGDANSLDILVAEDPLILDRCMIEKSDRFMQSPLHVAASLGHLDFTTKILSLKPELAKQLDQSTKSSALHLASEKGQLEVVEKLVQVMPSMCFARDQDGRNPIHVAAINDQFLVLEFLVRANPVAAQERTHAHETILHLCVKYAKINSLKYLMKVTEELINAKDAGGNTILHLAVVAQQHEIVKLLVANKKLQRNAINNDGLTAMDCLLNTDGVSDDENELRVTLKRGRTMKAKYVKKHEHEDVIWLDKQRNALMVVAGLIAAMAFQYGVNPNWEIKDDANKLDMQYTFDHLMIWNTISFVSALSVILLLVGGLPCKRLFVVILMLTMWLSISTILWTYFIALGNPSTTDVGDGVLDTIFIAFLVWGALVFILLLGHTIRFLIKGGKKLVHIAKPSWRKYVRPLWYKHVLHRELPVVVAPSYHGVTSPSTTISMNSLSVSNGRT